MSAAHPLPLPFADDDLDVAALDDLAHLRPEVRAAIEQAEENIRTGKARLIAHADVPVALEEIRRQRGG